MALIDDVKADFAKIAAQITTILATQATEITNLQNQVAQSGATIADLADLKTGAESILTQLAPLLPPTPTP